MKPIRQAFKWSKPNRRKAGSLHHLAFHAESPMDVDLLYQEIMRIPAVIVNKPDYYPEYCADYYAFFF